MKRILFLYNIGIVISSTPLLKIECPIAFHKQKESSCQNARYTSAFIGNPQYWEQKFRSYLCIQRGAGFIGQSYNFHYINKLWIARWIFEHLVILSMDSSQCQAEYCYSVEGKAFRIEISCLFIFDNNEEKKTLPPLSIARGRCLPSTKRP